jgi:electron transfer flavoprotein alpha/beta subunit
MSDGGGAPPAGARRLFVLLKVAPRPADVYFSASRAAVDATNAERVIGACDRTALEVARILALEAAGTGAGGAGAGVGGAGAGTPAVEVAALSWAPAGDEKVLRAALATGATRLLHITTPLDEAAAADPLVVASGLAAALGRREPWLVLCGDESADESRGAVGPMVAALLGWPFIGGVVRAKWAGGGADGAGGAATLEVEAEEGPNLVSYVVRPPAFLAVNRHGPAPKAASPLQLMKAFRQPVERLEVEVAAPALKVRSLATTEVKRRLNEPIPGAVEDALAMLWAKLRERRVI